MCTFNVPIVPENTIPHRTGTARGDLQKVLDLLHGCGYYSLWVSIKTNSVRLPKLEVLLLKTKFMNDVFCSLLYRLRGVCMSE